MSDSSAGNEIAEPAQPTIDSLVADLKPMGDLSRFIIEDLTADEEDEFFAILDDA